MDAPHEVQALLVETARRLPDVTFALAEIDRRIAVARTNTWTARVTAMSELIEARLAHRGRGAATR
jgi:hypothetical protein